jgi:hypothetical protein
MWPTRCNLDAFESLVRVSLDVGRSALPRGAVNRLHFLAKADGDLSFWTLRDTVDKSAAAQTAYYAANELAASDHGPIVLGFKSAAGRFQR